METARYEALKHLLNKTITIDAIISRRITQPGTSNTNGTICLQDVTYENKLILDHTWVQDTINLGTRHKQGAHTTLTVFVQTRKRPGDTIFDSPKLDIQLILKD